MKKFLRKIKIVKLFRIGIILVRLAASSHKKLSATNIEIKAENWDELMCLLKDDITIAATDLQEMTNDKWDKILNIGVDQIDKICK